MKNLLETALLLTVLTMGVLSIGYLAKHSPKAKTGIENHLMGK